MTNNLSTAPLLFPNGMTVAEIRIARPTDRLDEVVNFYRDGLGLPELYRFADHDGYDGAMLGLPGRSTTSSSRITATAALVGRRLGTTCWCCTFPKPQISLSH